MVRVEPDDVLLNDLFKHPGFEVLKQRIEIRREKDGLQLADKILAATQPINQRSIDEVRGFWRGAEWFLRETKRGANAFDKGADE